MREIAKYGAISEAIISTMAKMMRAKASRVPNFLTQESIDAKGATSPASGNLAVNRETPETNEFQFFFPAIGHFQFGH